MQSRNMYDGVYEPSLLGAANQSGQQHSTPNSNAFNENYPAFYGPGTVAPDPGHYPSEMVVRQPDRRPLHPVQQGAPSIIGKIAQNTQRQQQMMHMYQGRPQPMQSDSSMMCGLAGPAQSQLAERQRQPYSHYAYSQPVVADFSLSQSAPPVYQQQQQRGYYAQSAPAPFYPDSQEAPQSQQDYGRGMVMYSPPDAFAGFTPMKTSTPLQASPTASGFYPSRGPHAQGMAQGMAQGAHQASRAEATPEWVQPPAPTPAKRPALQQRGQRGQVQPLVHTARQQKEPSARQDSLRFSLSQSAAPSRMPSQTGSAASTATSKAAGSTRSAQPSNHQGAETSQSSSGSGSRTRATPAPERGLRILTGSVDNILSWGRKLDEETRPNIHFEIIGSLDSAVRGSMYSSVIVTLRSLEGGAVLTTVFWEIDRPLSPPPKGTIVLCVCRLCPKWPAQQGSGRRMPRMQLLRVRALSIGQAAHFKRAQYVSSFCVQQGVLAGPAASAKSAAPTPAPAPPARTPLKQALISQYTAPQPGRPSRQ